MSFERTFAIAPGHENIHIFFAQISVQYRLKAIQHLDLIQQQIIHSVIRYFGADICGKFLRVSTSLFLVHLNQTFTNQVKIICRIKGEADDMVCIHAGFQQVMVKQIVQQKGFAASSDTGDDLNEIRCFSGLISFSK